MDHCGGAGPLADAVAALREAGFEGLVLGCVPVVTSAAAAEVVASFAADRLPPGYLDAIMSAPDPTEEGVTAAVNFAEDVLTVPGVDGVNLSAGAGPGQELAVTRAMAEVSRRVLGARAAGRPRPAASRAGLVSWLRSARTTAGELVDVEITSGLIRRVTPATGTLAAGEVDLPARCSCLRSSSRTRTWTRR